MRLEKSEMKVTPGARWGRSTGPIGKSLSGKTRRYSRVDARSLSEAPRGMKIDEWRDAGPGALSIEPLEVSRWRGEQDVLGYGF